MRSRNWILERRAALIAEMVEESRSSEFRKLFSVEAGEFVTTCRRSSFFSDDEVFKYRDVVITCRRGKIVHAVAKLREWAACGEFTGGREFVFSADAVSQSDYENAEMLMDHWDEFDHPMESGEPLIIFERLVIAAAHPDIWPEITSAIDKAFKRVGGTMVLKAFPLEWEGSANGMPVADEPQFGRRLVAMKRLYKRQLGMEEVPDNEDGWMWKAIGRSVPPSPKRARQANLWTSDLAL
jgi:hypothetical protein